MKKKKTFVKAFNPFQGIEKYTSQRRVTTIFSDNVKTGLFLSGLYSVVLLF